MTEPTGREEKLGTCPTCGGPKSPMYCVICGGEPHAFPKHEFQGCTDPFHNVPSSPVPETEPAKTVGEFLRHDSDICPCKVCAQFRADYPPRDAAPASSEGQGAQAKKGIRVGAEFRNSRGDIGPDPPDDDARRVLRDPTPAELESPQFNAVWQAIKGWDLQRESGLGYSGATGTDVCTILDALARASSAQTGPPCSKCGSPGAWQASHPPLGLRDPLPHELQSRVWNAVWEAIKVWDIQRSSGAGYSGATGTDVCTIFDAMCRSLPARSALARELRKHFGVPRPEEVDETAAPIEERGAQGELPSWESCIEAVEAKLATPLQRFIFDNTPSGEELERGFYEGLKAAIDDFNAQARARSGSASAGVGLVFHQHHIWCSTLSTQPVGSPGCGCRLEFGATPAPVPESQPRSGSERMPAEATQEALRLAEPFLYDGEARTAVLAALLECPKCRSRVRSHRLRLPNNPLYQCDFQWHVIAASSERAVSSQTGEK